MSKTTSPSSRGRRTPENKNNNVNDILSGAKKNFLSATEKVTTPIKTPGKRPASPESSSAAVASPKSLLKHPSISLGTPPKKPKFWKTRWQEKITGTLQEKSGGRKKKNEADKLLVDEGVIQMLNKVPSVFGDMPRSSSSTSNRAQRVRNSVNKQSTTVNNKQQQQAGKVKRQSSTDSRKISVKTVKQEPVEETLIVSPKRAVRNISRDLTSVQQEVVAGHLSLIKDDDCFSYLTELPSEQLDLLMNCDIRYSLPRQGAPAAHNKPSKNKREDVRDSKKSSPESSTSSSSSTAALVKVKPVNLLSTLQHNHKLPPLPVRPDNYVETRLHDLLQHYQSEHEPQEPEHLVPGQYSQIHLRFYDTFAQISLTSPKTRLKGSLNPSIIDEITHALSYTSRVGRVRGVVVTGVGGVFCQGVDLHYLCQDSVERRKLNSAQMSAAVERLVLAITSFPKLLVAAVNGDASGLGVTILPLFDIVYANDKATFNTYYSR